MPDVFVERIQVTQGVQDSPERMPLIAGKSSTWVRVATGYSGGGDVVDVDGALLVEPEGQPGECCSPRPHNEMPDLGGSLAVQNRRSALSF